MYHLICQHFPLVIGAFLFLHKSTTLFLHIYSYFYHVKYMHELFSNARTVAAKDLLFLHIYSYFYHVKYIREPLLNARNIAAILSISAIIICLSIPRNGTINLHHNAFAEIKDI